MPKVIELTIEIEVQKVSYYCKIFYNKLKKNRLCFNCEIKKFQYARYHVPVSGCVKMDVYHSPCLLLVRVTRHAYCHLCSHLHSETSFTFARDFKRAVP